MYLKHSLFFSIMVTLVGCQSLPQSSQPSTQQGSKKTESATRNPDGVQVTPYDQPEIKRESMNVIIPPQQKKTTQTFDDGRNLPAFKKLIQQTQSAYKSGKWTEAEQAALQAQRIAPQSAETYMYLALVANNTNQAKKADALARRGLSYAQSNAMKRQLWQIVLKAAQNNKDATSLKEAQAQIKAL
ncbi:tetratricopeptide repeat protein [Acinetobacter shaoyimingii]|uniref:Tetratricopeptide repeat protein n=1 Tax=Acinetobacter shaoyimingii TaxID=2715164 RepID=A0A6G8RUG8_9GAMM|nr:tetratricopeptide repeat protein [Acinetobacter shaoyimingii]QIO05470.1 tetratricopeptide repeat protein [Acinetobacter shaoyimingii]